jgi:microsomal dipeptidase-like Zn-dependent dipeptidase
MKFGSNEERLVTLPRMMDGHLDASIMVAYLPQGERTNEAHKVAAAKANHIITQIEEMVSAHGTEAGLAYTPDDLYRLKHEGKKAIMMGIENGYAIGHDLSLVEHFRKRGIVYMTLCHNGDNDICDSARKSNNEHGGISKFGADVIRELNRVGMMVDLSHASEKTFYDALDISQVPIVCSHSSCRSLCDHPRNLTDEQMKRLASKGGVMQITFYEGFLRQDGQASLLDAVEHINYAVNIMGIEHVGIGTDFDGDGGVRGLRTAADMLSLTRRLMAEGLNERSLRKLWGGNFVRVMSRVQYNTLLNGGYVDQ